MSEYMMKWLRLGRVSYREQVHLGLEGGFGTASGAIRSPVINANKESNPHRCFSNYGYLDVSQSHR